jgi:hypothetical protein
MLKVEHQRARYEIIIPHWQSQTKPQRAVCVGISVDAADERLWWLCVDKR